jgi:hypothetical protein
VESESKRGLMIQPRSWAYQSADASVYTLPTATKSFPTLSSVKCNVFSPFAIRHTKLFAHSRPPFVLRFQVRPDGRGRSGRRRNGRHGRNGSSGPVLATLRRRRWRRCTSGFSRLYPCCLKALKLILLVAVALCSLSDSEEEEADEDPRDPERARTSSIVSTLPSPTSTRARSRNSLFRSTSFARVARVGVGRRVTSRSAELATVRV